MRGTRRSRRIVVMCLAACILLASLPLACSPSDEASSPLLRRVFSRVRTTIVDAIRIGLCLLPSPRLRSRRPVGADWLLPRGSGHAQHSCWRLDRRLRRRHQLAVHGPRGSQGLGQPMRNCGHRVGGGYPSKSPSRGRNPATSRRGGVRPGVVSSPADRCSSAPFTAVMTPRFVHPKQASVVRCPDRRQLRPGSRRTAVTTTSVSVMWRR
jgi:hypothetical protein